MPSTVSKPRSPPGLRLPLLACALAAFLVAPVEAQVVRQLTDTKVDWFGLTSTALDDSGTTLWFDSTADPQGTNPTHARRIAGWDLGADIRWQLGALVGTGVSVSDDGQWLAFTSTGNPAGSNADGSRELFLVSTDLSIVRQLTDNPGTGGEIKSQSIAGSGNRVAFRATADPLGSNPDHDSQLFVVDADGTGLHQLTAADVGINNILFAISDDGDRLVFAHHADLLADGGGVLQRLFAIDASGAGLRRLAATTVRPDAAALSGDGTHIAFHATAQDGFQHVFVVDWDDTGLQDLGRGSYPALSDDGRLLFYLNRDVWSKDLETGDPAQALTSFDDPLIASRSLAASGNGNRVAFALRNWETGVSEPMVIDADGGNPLQRNDHGPGRSDFGPDISAGGNRVVFGSNADHLGTDPECDDEIYVINTDGMGLAQVTSQIGTDSSHTWIGADETTIVFMSYADLTGTDPPPDQTQRAFTVQADGSGLLQLSESYPNFGDHPTLAASADVVVYQDFGLSRVALDGTARVTVTEDPWTLARAHPRISADGQWVVFHSRTDVDGQNPAGDDQILRARTDGTLIERITTGNGDALDPDVSGDGRFVVYCSEQDPLGTNADGNYEIFLYDCATAILRQLTVTSDSHSRTATISQDGAWVYFLSGASFTEPSFPVQSDLYRVATSGGAVERVAGLNLVGLGVANSYRTGYLDKTPLSVSADGSRAVFATTADWSGENADRNQQIFLIDFTERPSIFVGAATPTLVTWDVEAGPRRYDVIRGDVANLGAGPGNTVDLGPVICLENDSIDNTTAGFDDPLVPASGQALFFLYRGSPGIAVGPGSWGKGTGSLERVAGAGSCE